MAKYCFQIFTSRDWVGDEEPVAYRYICIVILLISSVINILVLFIVVNIIPIQLTILLSGLQCL